MLKLDQKLLWLTMDEWKEGCRLKKFEQFSNFSLCTYRLFWYELGYKLVKRLYFTLSWTLRIIQDISDQMI